MTPTTVRSERATYSAPPAPLRAALALLAVLCTVLAAPLAALPPPPTLAATPEADPTDPFLVAQAAELGNDPAAIFAFVRDEIAYEVYAGSLRGARGTLWSGAGNSTDKSSLLVGLLRAAGVEARWARGPLPQAQAKLLIASMFPPLRRVTGCVSPTVTAADPINDPALVAEAGDHFWAQLDDGGGFRDADPSFPGALLDDTFATLDATFDTLPEAVRHRVHLRLVRELTSPFAGLLTGGGAAQDLAVVLDTDAAAVELVGRPLTFGHFVATYSADAFFPLTTHTYSPYVIVGGGALDPAADGIVRGTDYQETLTSFTGGSQVLTGVFLEIDLVAPGGAARTYSRALLDRIGIAARRHGGAGITVDVDQPAQISPADLLTLEVLGGRYDAGVVARWNGELTALRDAVDDFEARLLATPEAGRLALGAESSTVLRDSFVAMARTRLAQFLLVSDEFAPRNARNLAVKAYHASPRLTIFSSRSRLEEDELVFEVGLDLLENGIRALPWPGQNPAAAIGFQIARGIQDTAFEAAVIPEPPIDGTTTRARLNAAAILDAAAADGITLAVLTADNRSRLADLDVPEQALILIGDALDAGRLVLVPESALTIDGQPRIGWYEMDLATGATIGVLDDGSHGIVESVAAQLFAYFQTGAIEFVEGYLIGWNVGAIASVVHSLALVAMAEPFQSFADAKTAAVAHAVAVVNEARAILDTLPSLPIEFPGFELGFELAVTPLLYALSQDPPLEDVLIAPAPNPAFDTLGGPGLDLGIEPEPLLYLPVAGAAVPTLFRVGIHHGGATEDLFELSFDAVPPGFTAATSVDSVPVGPGETAEVGVCLRPSGPLGPPGSNAAFTVRVTPQSNPGSAVAEPEPFVLPAIHGVVLDAAPAELSALPGTPAAVTLTLRSAGNVPESIDLTLTLPPGLGGSGVPANVALAAGASTMLAASFTPAGGTPLNTTLVARVTADFAGLEPVTLDLPVRVGAPGADAIHAAAVAARELGEHDLALRLADLGVALNQLVGDPDDAVLRGQALAALSSILSLLGNLQALAGFIPDLAAARDALAAADTPAEVLGAITGLGDALDPFATSAQGLVAHAVEVFLTPSSRLVQPGQPAVFDLLLHNVGSEPTSYDLAAGLVPAGVTPMLSDSSVLLAPDAFSAGITLTLTQAVATELVAGAFRVDVSPAGLPAIVTSAHGALTARADFLAVVAVTPDPAFVAAGDPVAVSVRLLNAVNREQPALVSYRVLDPSEVEVFASLPVATTLTVEASLVTLDLGALDTTGFADGVHTLEVEVTDPGAVPIPGGSGEAVLLIGSPVTAALAVDPEVVAPGDATVTATLEIASLPPPAVTPAVVGQLSIATPVFDVAVNGDLVYVCGSGGVHVVDVSDRTMPVLVRTVFAFPHSWCEVTGGRLIALDRGPDGNIAVQRNGSLTNYDLAVSGTPANPFRTQTIFFNYQFSHDAVLAGNRLYATTNLVRFEIPSGDVIGQNGDVFSFDLSNPGNLTLDDVLFNTNGGMAQPPLFASGSDFNMFGLVQPDAATLLVASTTSTGGDTQTGDGILRIVDVTDPEALAETATFVVPGTVLVQGIALEGDLALILASEGGWRDPFTDVTDIGPTGDIVLVTLDVADPQNPVVLDSQTLARSARGLGGPIALGSGQFVITSIGLLTDTPQALVIDASDPVAPAVGTPIDLAAEPRRGAADASFLYLADADGLTIFSLGGAPTPITAAVRVPNDGSASVVPDSWSVEPDSVVAGPDYDTLTWTLQNGASLTWSEDLPDMQPGESRVAVVGATVDFVYSGTPGSIELPAVAVASEQILAIDPALRTVQPGASTTYQIVARNPGASAVTYDLSVHAVPPAWVDLPTSVLVGAEDEAVLELTLAPDSFAVVGDYPFAVLATSGGTAGSASALLEVAGAAVLPSPSPQAAGVAVTVSPAQATGGQGTPAPFVARVTNTGSATASFDLGGLFPAGFSAVFHPPTLLLQPGLDQYRDVALALTPPIGALGGAYPFQVAAAVTGDPSVTGQAPATIVVSTLGVALELEPDPPGSITDFDLTVTNTGVSNATYTLALAGPLAGVGALGSPMVTLPASQSTIVPVTLGALDGVLAGVHPLLAVATAQADPAVQAIAVTPVEVPASVALEAELAPDRVVTQPGSVERLLLTASNAGNTELEVRVFISALDGPVEAQLLGPDGQPTAMVEGLRLPPFSGSPLAIDASLLAEADGEVTARVELSNDAGIAATATAQLDFGVCGGGGYDVDLDGEIEPLTDGLLVIRNRFGFTGAALVTAVLGVGATRSDPTEIAAHLDCLAAAMLLDLDGDEQALPLTDGLLLVRYLFGFRGPALVGLALGPDCKRCAAESIEDFVASGLGD